MDPDANLREQRELAAAILAAEDAEPGSVARLLVPEQAARLAELVEALDEWLAHAGHLPTAWNWPNTRAARRPRANA